MTDTSSATATQNTTTITVNWDTLWFRLSAIVAIGSCAVLLHMFFGTLIASTFIWYLVAVAALIKVVRSPEVGLDLVAAGGYAWIIILLFVLSTVEQELWQKTPWKLIIVASTAFVSVHTVAFHAIRRWIR